MTVGRYIGPNGPLALGPSIGRGGEGEVFALADGSRRAVKIYDKPDAAREAKVRSMIADLAGSCAGVAFPQAVVLAQDGSFAGFTMSLVEGCQPIHQLYAPGSRRRQFPEAAWPFLLRAAANVARVFGRIHAAGAVVGDVNGSGLLVSSRATVVAIDADSFQWSRSHLCRVGMPEFTPPELQGRSLDGVIRTADHDGFGLAVILFMLLFLGRHPNAGVPRGRDLSLTEAITRKQFAYSAIRQVRLAPPRGTLLLTDLPLAVRTLFERAFGDTAGARPKPSEWMDELERLEAGLTVCSANHRHALPHAHGECPWCRIERDTSGKVFGEGNATERRDTSPIRQIVEGTLRRARTSLGEALQPQVFGIAAPPSDEALEAFRRLGRPSSFAGSVHFVRPSSIAEPFRRRHRQAQDQFNAAQVEWRDRIGASAADRLAERLADELRHYDRLRRREAAAIAEVEPALRTAQVRRDLAGIALVGARIGGLGQPRLAALSTMGIRTAADVSRSSLAAVRRVGERTIAAMLLWRDTMAVQASRRVTIAADEVAAAKANVRHIHRADVSAAEKKLDRLARDLERNLDDVAAEARRYDDGYAMAYKAWKQAAIDLTYLGIDEVAVPTRRVTAVPAKSGGARTPGSPLAPRCPLCGGSMVKRWSRSGSPSARPFLGCANYPGCTGARQIGRGTP